MSISENDKRWMVVLIAADKIVAPLLRDFGEKEFVKLYHFLDDHLLNISPPCNLNTLTYSICHPPPPHLEGLKFKNINNNDGKTKPTYNYAVNSPVDLAKLYLPAYLAKFAAFDNSMDMSAVLRLLGYDKYPTQVFVSSNPFLDLKLLADDVKNNVRNLGAHYDESIWTELFIHQCFEKLVALVEALVLPADQEKRTLDQLHQWETNGWELIIAKDMSDLVDTFFQNQEAMKDTLEEHDELLINVVENTRRLSSIVMAISDGIDSLRERVVLLEERHNALKRFFEEVFGTMRVNRISNACGQLGAPVVSTSSSFSSTSAMSADSMSAEARHMNEESVVDEISEGSTSSGISENFIDFGRDDLSLPENQLHLRGQEHIRVERITPQVVLLKVQNGAPFKIEFNGKLPEEMESGIVDFEELTTGVPVKKLNESSLGGNTLPYSPKEGVFKVKVYSPYRKECLGETTITYIDLIEEALKQAVSDPQTMRKFLEAAIPSLNEFSGRSSSNTASSTNAGSSGGEISSLSAQLLRRFIYAAAKVNALWFIRLIFDQPAGRTAFDLYKGRLLLPEYVALANGHSETAKYLRDVTKRYSDSERTDEEKLNNIDWQGIVTAIKATQENPNVCSEIVKTEKSSQIHEGQADDLKPSVSFQQVREKEPWLSLSDEQLNYLKFAFIVTNEFPKVMRPTFRTMWDNTFGHLPGFKLWDDSTEVRNLFLTTEGRRTKVPTDLSYEKWSLFHLTHATIFARSFALPDSAGHPRTLYELYVRPRGVVPGTLHSSVTSPAGCAVESSALAIDQLRLLRFQFAHSSRAELDKLTFDRSVQLTKEAFIALGFETDQIDAIALNALNSSTLKLSRQETRADVKFLEGLSSSLEAMRNLLHEVKENMRGTESEEIIAMLGQKIDDLEKEQDQSDASSEIVETEKGTNSRRGHGDDFKPTFSFQQVNEEQPRQGYSDEQLNYLKFAFIVLNEFPKAIRQAFRTTWDNTFGYLPGFQLWDDSATVRNLFLAVEGGKTKVPVHLSYEEWDLVALFQATIFARSFALPDSRGHHRTLAELYVKPRKLPHGSFHSLLASPVGCGLESLALAIDQLRRLKNQLCHSVRAEIDKVTFDYSVQLAKGAFMALGFETDQIDAIALQALDPSSLEHCKVEDGIKQAIRADVKFLDGFSSSLEAIRKLFQAVKETVGGTESEEIIAMLGQTIDDLEKEQAQSADNRIDNPPKMSLTVPKMCDIKVFMKRWSDVQLPIDILLSTVEECEFLSAFVYLQNPFQSYHEDLGHVYFGKIGQLTVALVKCGGETMPVDSAIYSKNAIMKMRPKAVFLVGVCCSLNSTKARLGDVFITSKLATHSQRGMRALESKTSSLLIRHAGDGWMAPLHDPDDGVVRIHRDGVLLSVQDRNMCEELIQAHPDATAIEVQDALATAITDLKVECIAVKGISHYGGAGKESESWKNFASVMAASVVAHVLKDRVVFESWPHFQAGTLPGSRLPPRDTNFVGRARECEEIIECSARENTRLVSIFGPPGFGKTSVANAVAHKLESLGLPVYFFSLRRLQSISDLTAELLILFEDTVPICQTPPFVSNHDQILQRLSLISERIVLILDDADTLLDTADFLYFLQDVLSRAKQLKLIITARKSFKSLQFQSHEAVRIGPLDESSAQELVSKLLPDATASDCTQLLQICTNVPLLLRTICNLISEGNGSINSYLDLLGERPLGRLLGSDFSLSFLCNDAFRGLSAKEKGTLVSLSVFPNDFYVKAAAAVMGITRIPEAKRILRNLQNKSLLESDSKLGSFSMHPLIRSLAQEIGETELKGTLIASETRFREFYISQFAWLNEKFLKGDSVMASVTFYEDEENIIQSLKLRPGSDSKTAEVVFKVLVHAELFLHSLFWTDEDRFVSIYDSAVKAAETLGEKEFHRELLVSSAFSEITRGTQRGRQLLYEAKHLQTAALSTSAREKGKLLCYLGIYHLFTGETEEGLHCLQTSLPKMEVNLEETVLRLIISQVLYLYDSFHMKSSSEAQCYKKILQEYTEAGNTDLLLTATLESAGNSAMEMVKDKRGALNNQPLMAEVLFLVSKAAERFTNIEIKRKMSDIATNVLRNNEASSPPTVLGFSHFHTNLRMLTNDDGKDPEKERRFQELRKSFLQKRVRNSDLSSETSAPLTANTQHGAQCLLDAVQAEQRELAVRMKLLGPNDASTAESYYSLGVQQYASGNFTSSLESFMGALTIRLQYFGKIHPGTADCYHSLGVTQLALGDLPSAFQSFQSALDIRLSLQEKHPNTASTYHYLGATQLAMGDFISARESFQRGLDIRLSIFGEVHVSTAESYHSLGNVAHSVGEFSSALLLYHRALDIRRNMLGEVHTKIAESYQSVGEVQSSLGDLTSALQSHQCALNIWQKVLGEEHQSTAQSYQSLGDTKLSLNERESALKFYQLALNIRVKVFGEEHLRTADSHHSMGETYLALNKLESALLSFQCERDIRLKMVGREHPSIARSYHSIGDTYFALNDLISALQSFQCALDIRLKVFGEEHSSTADSYYSLGETFYALNNVTSARDFFQHALSTREKLYGEEHPDTAESYYTLSVTEYAGGNYNSALHFSQKALDISHKLFGEDNQDTIEIYETLGAIHCHLGDFSSAAQSFRQALASGHKLIGKDHSRTADNYNSLGDTQNAKGDFVSAVDSYKSALQIKLKQRGKSHK
ncbi:uncharacterized protein LOC111345557 isoform X1 [Stylophora pistillata]|uniref:uncharacterized protein LOC111345557 isoform X1 n=1 Tax=Stylophora pistillata TaxID=50429 RepID=UPI000C0397B1|nr:uncharacterized protein LOC111345557 isoform X1 [Stylophora pistillata]